MWIMISAHAGQLTHALCNDQCKAKACKNSLKQLAQDKVHAVYNEHVGWKVVANERIEEGTLVLEYTGMVCIYNYIYSIYECMN